MSFCLAFNQKRQAVLPMVPSKSIESLRDTETILLVEDHAPLLDLAHEFLQGLGYHLLTANLPLKAP